MNELRVVKVRLLGSSICDDLVGLFFHLLELGHLDKDFVHFIFRKAVEQFLILSLHDQLFRHSIFVQSLQILDPILLVG